MMPTGEEETFSKIDHDLQSLVDQLNPLDNKLSSDLLQYKISNKIYFEELKKKIKEKKKELKEKELMQAQLIRDFLFKDNVPAERIQNMLSYEMANPEQFIRFIYDNSDPVMKALKVLAY